MSEDEFHKEIPEEEEKIYALLKEDLRELAETHRNRPDLVQDEIIAHLKRQIALLKRVK